jgi:hypothetical protein
MGDQAADEGEQRQDDDACRDDFAGSTDVHADAFPQAVAATGVKPILVSIPTSSPIYLKLRSLRSSKIGLIV